jgi:hypothetical protein
MIKEEISKKLSLYMIISQINKFIYEIKNQRSKQLEVQNVVSPEQAQ